MAAEDARGPIDIAVICAGVVSPCGILGRGATDPRTAYLEFAVEFERQAFERTCSATAIFSPR